MAKNTENAEDRDFYDAVREHREDRFELHDLEMSYERDETGRSWDRFVGDYYRDQDFDRLLNERGIDAVELPAAYNDGSLGSPRVERLRDKVKDSMLSLDARETSQDDLRAKAGRVGEVGSHLDFALARRVVELEDKLSGLDWDLSDARRFDDERGSDAILAAIHETEEELKPLAAQSGSPGEWERVHGSQFAEAVGARAISEGHERAIARAEQGATIGQEVASEAIEAAHPVDGAGLSPF